MPTYKRTHLPPNVRLSHYSQKADDLFSIFNRNTSKAITRIQANIPQFQNATKTNIIASNLTVQDMRNVVARENNFESWERLTEYLIWDLAVLDQDTNSLVSLLEENPKRATQKVLTFWSDGTFWEMVPLHYSNNKQMMGLLLTYGACPNTPGESALAANSTPEFIDFALDRGESLENQYYNGSVLSLAAHGGYLETVKHYIKRGAKVNSRDERPHNYAWQGSNTGETALHRAAFSCPSLRGQPSATLDPNIFTRVVRLLVYGGANVNTKTNHNVLSDMGPNLILKGETPLHFAALSGNLQMVETLRAHGASLESKSTEGLTPLDYATIKHHNKLAAVLR